MNSVGAADRGCVLELQGTALQHLAQTQDLRSNESRSLGERQGLGGIDHIG